MNSETMNCCPAETVTDNRHRLETDKTATTRCRDCRGQSRPVSRKTVLLMVKPHLLCYCFGFDESRIRDELARTGTTTTPDRIAKLIREGLCACEERNPSGACCLGEVNRTVKRLSNEGR